MSSLLQFLEFFMLYLILGSLIIVGFYIITRGEKVTQPDGTVFRKGKIFKQWSLFWEQTNGSVRRFYTEDSLRQKLRWLKDSNTLLGAKLQLSPKAYSFIPKADVSGEDLAYIADVLNCSVMTDHESHIYLYSDEPVYYWPDWLRYPLSQCPPCMASIYGTILYWVAILLSDNVMAWTAHAMLATLFFWIVFCLALAALNKYVYNKIEA